MVLRQIRDLMGESYVLLDHGSDNQHVIKLKSAKLTPSQNEQLDLLLDRRMQLLRQISAEDYQRVKEILEVAGDCSELDAMQGI